ASDRLGHRPPMLESYGRRRPRAAEEGGRPRGCTRECARMAKFLGQECEKALAFVQIDTRILPKRQKKGGGMAKAKVLKFDAAGPGLSKTEILKVCEAENVRFMRLQFTDIFGVIKNVELPSSQFSKALD